MTSSKIKSSKTISTADKPLVGVSSCLLGEYVRHDGNHKHAPYITDILSRYFCLRSFCPEVAIGLGTPRKPIHLVKIEQQIRCVFVEDNAKDVSEELVQCSQQQQWHRELSGYIVKAKSPSCGNNTVSISDGVQTIQQGSGLYIAELMARFPHLPIADECQLAEPDYRENFIRQVYTYTQRTHSANPLR